MTLVELLRECGVEFRLPGQHHHVTSQWIGVDCCYCSPGQKRFRMGLSMTTRAVNCWTCGVHRYFPTLLTLTGLRPDELADRLGGIDFRRGEERKVGGKVVIPAGVEPLLMGPPNHREYLRGRGFNAVEIAKLWDVRAIGPCGGRLNWRLWIPVHVHGEVVSWTTRAVGGQEPRYVNAEPSQEVMPIKSVLYGLDYCRHAVVVTEGPTDVWRIGPGAVCTFGVNYTTPQVLQLAKFPVRVVFFDAAAEARGAKLANELAALGGGKTYHVSNAECKDPGGMGLKGVKWIRSRFLDD
jgi:hypothetical protein